MRSFLGKMVLVAVATCAVAPVSASAQQARTVFRGTPSATAPRQATERRPETVVPAPVVSPAGYVPVYPVYPRYPVAYTLVPAVIMSDGSVYADFGYGYERVVRTCASATPQSVGAGGRPIFSNRQPDYIGPPPVQSPAIQQNLARQYQPQISQAAAAACYGRDAHGRVVVYR